MKAFLLAAAAVVAISGAASAQGLVLGTGSAATQSESGTVNNLQAGSGMNSGAAVLGLTAGGMSTSARASGNGATTGFAGVGPGLQVFSGANNQQTNSIRTNQTGFTAGLGLGATTTQGGVGGTTNGASVSQSGAAINFGGIGLFR